jgi:hypothetical protein
MMHVVKAKGLGFLRGFRSKSLSSLYIIVYGTVVIKIGVSKVLDCIDYDQLAS